MVIINVDFLYTLFYLKNYHIFNCLKYLKNVTQIIENNLQLVPNKKVILKVIIFLLYILQ